MQQIKNFRHSTLAVSTICGLVIPACRPDASIRSYTVPKEQTEVAQAPAVEPTDRMLAAIVPVGNKAWFFKVAGPLGSINSIAPEIQTFFESIEVLPDAQKPGWTLPEGWEEQPGSGMRAATITIPVADGPMELSVLSLPWTDSAKAGVLANVNRWRGQMRLPAIGPAELSECSSKFQLGDVTAWRVDLRGRQESAPMAASFANGSERRRPARAGARPPGQAAGAPQMEPPKGWDPGQLNSFRKAAFIVKAPGQQAEITVMEFPASSGSAMSDPLANLNRWRSELGMENIAERNLPGQFEAIELGDSSGDFVALFPDNAGGQATLVAMVQRDGLVWFFKMKGDRDLVAGQQGEFRKFLKSVRFAPASKSAAPGDNDGNS